MALTDKLTAIADAIRAKTGKEAEMTLSEMPSEISNIQTGSNIPDGTAVTFGNVITVSENVPTHASYNGVVLPIIPENLIAQYQYAFIRQHKATNQYRLILSKNGFKYDGSSSIRDKNEVKNPEYYFPIGETSETTWTETSSSLNFSGWAINSDIPLVWSNHDVLWNQSTTVYFAGSEAVPEAGTTGTILAPAEREEAYSITSEDLNALGAAVQSKTGKTELLTVDDMISEIMGIPGGNTLPVNAKIYYVGNAYSSTNKFSVISSAIGQ